MFELKNFVIAHYFMYFCCKNKYYIRSVEQKPIKKFFLLLIYT